MFRGIPQDSTSGPGCVPNQINTPKLEHILKSMCSTKVQKPCFSMAANRRRPGLTTPVPNEFDNRPGRCVGGSRAARQTLLLFTAVSAVHVRTDSSRVVRCLPPRVPMVVRYLAELDEQTWENCVINGKHPDGKYPWGSDPMKCYREQRKKVLPLSHMYLNDLELGLIGICLAAVGWKLWLLGTADGTIWQ
eukprot:g59663.t1